MNTLKIILTTIFFTLFIGTQQTTAQNQVKILKNKVKDCKNKISANEVVLMSGIKALKRVNIHLENFKKSKKATKENIARKENIVNSIENRLTKLNAKIENQRKELTTLKIELAKKRKKKLPKTTPKNQEITKPNQNTNNTINTLTFRKQQLENARVKLEEDRKAKEIAYLKQQEALHLEAEKLKQLSNEIKAEEKYIVIEKGTLISDYEDDISINQEILMSGKEGLAKMKTKLDNAQLNPKTSKESIARKKAIIIKIEERLHRIQTEITNKQLELSKLK